MIKIGIVDDHQLFVKSLGLMLATFKDYGVVVEALNGKDLQEKWTRLKILPDMMLIDVNMPVMGGVETVKWLSEAHPEIKLVALSMNDSDYIIIDMIKAGCCAYLLKDSHPDELEKALYEINARGYYNGDASNINYRRLIKAEQEKEALHLSDKEKIFLQLACSDKTYKVIAAEMGLSERAIDNYREQLFQKLKVQSRVGLCLESLRRNIVKL